MANYAGHYHHGTTASTVGRCYDAYGTGDVTTAAVVVDFDPWPCDRSDPLPDEAEKESADQSDSWELRRELRGIVEDLARCHTVRANALAEDRRRRPAVGRGWLELRHRTGAKG